MGSTAAHNALMLMGLAASYGLLQAKLKMVASRDDGALLACNDFKCLLGTAAPKHLLTISGASF